LYAYLKKNHNLLETIEVTTTAIHNSTLYGKEENSLTRLYTYNVHVFFSPRNHTETNQDTLTAIHSST